MDPQHMHMQKKLLSLADARCFNKLDPKKHFSIQRRHQSTSRKVHDLQPELH